MTEHQSVLMMQGADLLDTNFGSRLGQFTKQQKDDILRAVTKKKFSVAPFLDMDIKGHDAQLCTCRM